MKKGVRNFKTYINYLIQQKEMFLHIMLWSALEKWKWQNLDYLEWSVF